jgi:hypothetical protein
VFQQARSSATPTIIIQRELAFRMSLQSKEYRKWQTEHH